MEYKKIRVLLVCSYGFSTSILVKKMQDYFSQKNYPFTVEAQSETEAQSNVDKFDVILIGPQVRFLITKFEKIVNKKIPIYIMETRPYGMQKVDEIIEKMLKDMERDGFIG